METRILAVRQSVKERAEKECGECVMVTGEFMNHSK